MSTRSARLALHQSALLRDLRLQTVRFLHADLNLGLTFASAAMAAGKLPKRKERNRTNAQKALDAVVKHNRRADLDAYESAKLDTKISLLRSALEKLDRKA